MSLIKRLCLCLALSLSFVLGLSAFAWAEENGGEVSSSDRPIESTVEVLEGEEESSAVSDLGAEDSYTNIVEAENLDFSGSGEEMLGEEPEDTGIASLENPTSPTESERISREDGLSFQEESFEGLYDIVNVATGFSLDVEWSSLDLGANIQSFYYRSKPAQRWSFVSAGDGSFYIKNLNSGLVLDVAWGLAEEGANIQQFRQKDSAAQRWRFASDGSGGYYIVSALSDGKSLEESLVLSFVGDSSAVGANVALAMFTGAESQSFQFLSANRVFEDGFYMLESALSGADDYVIDIPWGSGDSRIGAQAWLMKDSWAQIYKLTYDEATGYTTIMNANSCKYLEPAWESLDSGQTVWQNDKTSSVAQLWTLRLDPTGDCTFRNARSGLMLTLGGGVAYKGAGIIQWVENKWTDQLWSLVPSPLVADGAVVHFRNANGMVMQASGDTEGSSIAFAWADGSIAQKFQVKKRDGVWNTLECLNSGLVLTLDGGRVVLQPYTGADTQLWGIGSVGGECLKLTNKATGQVLDGSSPTGSVVVNFPDGRILQKWADDWTPVLSNGRYRIKSAIDTGFVIDIPGGSDTVGTSPCLATKSKDSHQVFEITWNSSGLYRILNVSNGLALAVESAPDPSNGLGSVVQSKENDNSNQLWDIRYDGGGLYTVYTMSNNASSRLDVSWGVAADGQLVQVFRPKDVTAQRWVFEEDDAPAIVSDYPPVSIYDMIAWQYEAWGSTWSSWTTPPTYDEILIALNPRDVSGYELLRFADLRKYSGLSGEQLDFFYNLQSPISDSVFKGYGWAFVSAAKRYNVNEAYLLGHAILETWWGYASTSSAYYGGGYIDGTYYEAGTYYNLYGIAAYDGNSYHPWLEYAVVHGWKTPDLAILGGAKFISDGYLTRSPYEQVTLYDMRWDTLYCATNKCRPYHGYASDPNWPKKISDQMGVIYAVCGVPIEYLDVNYRFPNYTDI